MSHFQKHVFFCTNQREDGQSCNDCGAQKLRDYAKQRCKELGIHGAGQVRINTAGCLDRCTEGPVLVIYPEETWYSYIDQEDIDEIINEHLLNDRPVDRLKI